MLSLETTVGSVPGKPRVAYVASYPPRECGIATFTRDLVSAIDRLNATNPGEILALRDPGQELVYPPCVRREIAVDDPASYAEAASYVNAGPAELVNVQHEYGLFGGRQGDYLLRFLDRLTKRVLITMHTVLPEPDPELRRVTQALAQRANRVIVLARSAIDILERDYNIQPDHALFIPHGVPNVSLMHAPLAKQALGLENRLVLATCGLMNPGKGIEYAIQSLAGLVDDFPDVLYLVVGETHPGVRAQNGEAYRERLQALVTELGLEQNVRFHNHYLSYQDLVLHLLAADVYVVPYLDLSQIVSGTLAYALGCGRAIVSTPSAYAREVLANGRGSVVPARDPVALADALRELLSDPRRRAAMQRQAYAYGHAMIWSRVAKAYIQAFKEELAGPRRAETLALLPALAGMEQISPVLDYAGPPLTQATGHRQQRVSAPEPSIA
ncbi:MAG: glycosyltransferase family 4 protein [Chloroflexota bacterium]